uniref:Uncharacterized protein n=1 Tax=Romanomermis culicivorax TaxID=13658 RepID=A0A915JNA8_ROMCU
MRQRSATSCVLQEQIFVQSEGR